MNDFSTDLIASLKVKIKNLMLESIPADNLDRMLEAEVKSYFTPRDHGYGSSRSQSSFSMDVQSIITTTSREIFAERIKELTATAAQDITHEALLKIIAAERVRWEYAMAENIRAHMQHGYFTQSITEALKRMG